MKQCEKIIVKYFRVSQEDGDVVSGKADESMSISSQRACANRFLLEHPEIHGKEIELIDDGYSGTNFSRPGIQRFFSLMNADLVQAIIIKDMSRFARNFLEAGFYLEHVFPEKEIRVISIADQFDSADIGENVVGLQLAVKNLINQLYSRDISRKIKSAVDLKKMRGEFVYGTAPFGYKKGEKRNTIVVDEPAAAIVRRIFELACHQCTITEIARILNGEHVITPSQYLSSIRGKYEVRTFWTYESIHNILTNRIYTGDTVPFKSHVVCVGSNRVKPLPEEEQVVIPETHDAIVSRSDYFLARTVIKGKKKTATNQPRGVLNTYLVCGCCGNKLSKGRSTSKLYRCANARYQPNSQCENVHASEKILEPIILRSIRTQLSFIDAERKATMQANQTRMSQLLLLEKEKSKLNRRIAAMQEQTMRLYERMTAGELSRSDYLLQKHEVNKSLDELVEEAQRIQLLIEEQRAREVHNDMTDITVKTELIDEADHLSREMMKALIKSIVIYPDGSIRIVWNFKNTVDAQIG